MLINQLNNIMLWIDGWLYAFITFLYKVFIVISQANLFTETTLRTFTDRIFTILGIVMLFYIAYEVLVLIASPDKVSGENQAKTLVSKLVKSIIIIILLPTIFKYMQLFQNSILNSNVIGNIILGSSSEAAPNDSLNTAGTAMALSIGQAFFHPINPNTDKEYSFETCQDEAADKPKICDAFIKSYDKALESGNAGYFFQDPELKDELNLGWLERVTDQKKEIIYYPIISTIAALLAIKMIVAFALDIGVRVAKLGFLQIVAPIPIAMNITKKESLSQTPWFKSLVDTYLELFMKLIIIYFAMFAISLVPEVISNLLPSNPQANVFIKLLATVAVILGILQFAKDAPELLKNLFNIKDFGKGISISKRLNDNTYAQRGVAMLGGAGASALSGGVNGKGVIGKAVGVAGGLFGGGYRGLKNSEGMTSWGQLGNQINRARAETDAAGTSLTNTWDNIKKDPKNFARQKSRDFGERVGEWLKGGVNKEKLEAAKAAQSALNKLYSTFQGSQAEKWDKNKDEQINDFRSGERVSVFELDANGNNIILKDANGKEVRDTEGNLMYKKMDLTSEKAINDYNDNMKIKSQIESFNKEGIHVQRTGKEFVKILENSLNSLGQEARQQVFSSAGINSMNELKQIFEKAGLNSLSTADGVKLKDLKTAMDNQTKYQQQLTESKENNK